jgi:murein DD-endopeptidase MepM/ murein hydrolase activator NlpD
MAACLRTALLASIVALVGCGRRESTPPVTPPPPQPAAALLLPASALHSLVYPTRQTSLTSSNPAGVFMPTASGNPESGLYGSVRTGKYGNRILPRFHEGIDIAPVGRDKHGRPTDEVLAAADGKVALISRSAGNSDYGIYVVLLHEDPVGTFYTLYAHMASVDPALREGLPVAAGARLGLMGNTALTPMPIARAHLHFEIGLLANARFLSWPQLPKKHVPGGLYNGQNLWGLDPVDVFRDFERSGGQLTLLEHMRRVPVAFEVITRARRLPDYFQRYPALWSGPPDFSGALVISAQEGGVVLAGRPADAEESERLGRAPHAVLRVDEQALGRNGRRIVVPRDGRWVLGSSGESWLDLLLHQ